MSTSEQDPFGWVGATVEGKYRVDAVVGHGGFGIVYRAHHLGFEEAVALKCLKLPKELQGADRDRFRESLVAEGRLLLQLSRATTGVVQALDVGAVVSPSKIWTPYLVLEWLEGSPLDRDLATRRKSGLGGRSLGEALELLAGAARALGVAHDMGIAHRDIKPANLFLIQMSGRPTIKVLDFGIAKVLADSESVTRAFEQTGGTLQAFTARYGAPEQFSRRFGATGPWTDVFALALVLIEVVLGMPALDGTDAAQLFVASSDKLLRPTLRARGFDLGDEIEGVLATALSVDPRERYPNANAFWDALQAAAQRDPSRLALRPPPIDDARPTRELGSDSLPHSLSGPAPASGAGAYQQGAAAGPQADRVLVEAPTELSSTQGIKPAESARGSVPKRRGGRLLFGIALTAFIIGGAAGTVLWLNRERAGLGMAQRPGLQRTFEEGAATPRPEEQTNPSAPAPNSTASAAPSPPPAAPGVPWPGTQFRLIEAGSVGEDAPWLDGFRIVRRAEAAPSHGAAFQACTEIGLSLCTEPQWELACAAFPEVGRDKSYTDSIEDGSVVGRGGSGCPARELLSNAGASERLGLCCERAIGMTTKNLQKQFLSSTAKVLRNLELALNQHDAAALLELLDDQVKLDGVERPKGSVVALLSKTFKAAPDLIVTHETCEIAVQASKVVKRSKRGRKLTSYETNSWTATCQQLRHQKGETAQAKAVYVFSPASKLRGISGSDEDVE
jgi:serine/threonine-protein kinase